MADEEMLHGGVANAGGVVRVGDHVLRPSNPHSTSIHRMLRSLAESVFTGASVPVGIDPDGRERLVFIIDPVPSTGDGATCREILDTFPSWFGIREANDGLSHSSTPTTPGSPASSR